MVKNNYKQEIANLENGLKSLKNLAKESKDRITSDTAIINIPVQEARIDFFKKGYLFRDKELKEQTKLGDKT